MTATQWIQSNQIMEQIKNLQEMGNGTLVWHVHIRDGDGTKLTDFTIDKPIQEAFEKARLEKIVELQKQFDEL